MTWVLGIPMERLVGSTTSEMAVQWQQEESRKLQHTATSNHTRSNGGMAKPSLIISIENSAFSSSTELVLHDLVQIFLILKQH